MTNHPINDDPPREDLDALLRTYDRGLASLETAAPQDLDAQIEMRRGLAERLELGPRLLLLYDLVTYPSETRRHQLEQMGCVVRGRELQGSARATVLRLEINRHPYVLTFREPPPSHEEVQAHLDLSSGEAPPQFSVCVVLDVSEPGSGWIPRRVDAFVPGAWVKDLLELSSRLDLLSRSVHRGPDDPDLHALKTRFGLT